MYIHAPQRADEPLEFAAAEKEYGAPDRDPPVCWSHPNQVLNSRLGVAVNVWFTARFLIHTWFPPESAARIFCWAIAMSEGSLNLVRKKLPLNRCLPWM